MISHLKYFLGDLVGSGKGLLDCNGKHSFGSPVVDEDMNIETKAMPQNEHFSALCTTKATHFASVVYHTNLEPHSIHFCFGANNLSPDLRHSSAFDTKCLQWNPLWFPS